MTEGGPANVPDPRHLVLPAGFGKALGRHQVLTGLGRRHLLLVIALVFGLVYLAVQRRQED